MNNDLISRSALKEAIDDYAEKRQDTLLWQADIEELIDNAPTVEITEEQAIDKLHETGWLPEHDRQMTERPQGKWNYIQSGMAVCPFCGASPHKYYKNFCPNCGADMRGKEE